MERKAHTDKFTEVEDRYAGYTVYDQHYEKIGNVDDLFLDEKRPAAEYMSVKMGFLGPVPPDPVPDGEGQRHAADHQGRSRQGEAKERSHLR